MTPARVGFCGASGTGKSTLAAHAAGLTGAPLCPVGARSTAAAMGLASPYDADAAGLRAEFQRRLVADKAAWEASHASFVSDRTVVDCLAYLALHEVRAVDGAVLTEVSHAFARYTHVFYCPVDSHCDTGDDLQRLHELAYHTVFDALLVGLLRRLDGAGVVYVLGMPDLGERRAAVAEALRGDELERAPGGARGP